MTFRKIHEKRQVETIVVNGFSLAIPTDSSGISIRPELGGIAQGPFCLMGLPVAEMLRDALTHQIDALRTPRN